MIEKLQAWMADPAERRRAMIVAAACILLIVLLIGKQALSPTTGPDTRSTQGKFRVPPKPMDNPIEATKEKPVAAKATPAVITPATPTEHAARITHPKAGKQKAQPQQPRTEARTAKQSKTRHAAAVKNTKEAKPESASAGKATKVRNGYYVQVGAFREQRHARHMMLRLRKRGWSVRIHRKKNGLYAVWVGPWPSQPLARGAQKQLGSQDIRGFIVKAPAR